MMTEPGLTEPDESNGAQQQNQLAVPVPSQIVEVAAEPVKSEEPETEGAQPETLKEAEVVVAAATSGPAAVASTTASAAVDDDDELEEGELKDDDGDDSDDDDDETNELTNVAPPRLLPINNSGGGGGRIGPLQQPPSAVKPIATALGPDNGGDPAQRKKRKKKVVRVKKIIKVKRVKKSDRVNQQQQQQQQPQKLLPPQQQQQPLLPQQQQQQPQPQSQPQPQPQPPQQVQLQLSQQFPQQQLLQQQPQPIESNRQVTHGSTMDSSTQPIMALWEQQVLMLEEIRRAAASDEDLRPLSLNCITNYQPTPTSVQSQTLNLQPAPPTLPTLPAPPAPDPSSPDTKSADYESASKPSYEAVTKMLTLLKNSTEEVEYTLIPVIIDGIDYTKYKLLSEYEPKLKKDPRLVEHFV